MIIAKSHTFFIVIGLLILNLSVIAKSWAAEDESRWQFSLGLGLGVRTNPVLDNDDIPLIILPQFSYQGERFFIQNLDIGYIFFQDNKQQFSLLLTPSYDQIYFNEWDISNFVDRSNFASIAKIDSTSLSLTTAAGPTVEQADRAIDKSGLHKRHIAGLAGLEYNQNIYDVDIQLQLLQEVTSYYDGNEIRFTLSKSINSGKHDIKLTLGANWQSAATVNYFYGVPESEASGSFAYDASGSVSGLLRVDWNYQLNEHWSLRFLTSYRQLGHSISDSSLVTKNNVITAFAGGVYHF